MEDRKKLAASPSIWQSRVVFLTLRNAVIPGAPHGANYIVSTPGHKFINGWAHLVRFMWR
jgi:hypothetical protein